MEEETRMMMNHEVKNEFCKNEIYKIRKKKAKQN